MRRGIDDRPVTQEELESGLYRRTMAPEKQEELQMKYVKFYMGIGCANAAREEVIELEDGATEEEIEEAYKEWQANIVDCAWWECDKDGHTVL